MSEPIVDMKGVERMLVIKMSALGDIAMTIRTVDAIAAAYPDLKIGWAARHGLADLLIGNPSLTELFEAPRGLAALTALYKPLRRFQADIVLDMQGLFVSGCVGLLSGARLRYTWEGARELSGILSGNAIIKAPSNQNAVENIFNFARLLGVEQMLPNPPSYLTQDPILIDRVENLLKDAHSPRVGMHIGASVPNKIWPLEHWAALADRLIDAGCSVILFGGNSEKEAETKIVSMMRTKPISLVGCTSPRELAAAISRCQVFVGGDTGATHIASLVQTPTVALMGPTDPARVGPYGTEHIILYLGLSCSPCYRHPTCGGRYQCMRDIEPITVFQACEKQIRQKHLVNLTDSNQVRIFGRS